MATQGPKAIHCQFDSEAQKYIIGIPGRVTIELLFPLACATAAVVGVCATIGAMSIGLTVVTMTIAAYVIAWWSYCLWPRQERVEISRHTLATNLQCSPMPGIRTQLFLYPLDSLDSFKLESTRRLRVSGDFPAIYRINPFRKWLVCARRTGSEAGFVVVGLWAREVDKPTLQALLNKCIASMTTASFEQNAGQPQASI